MNIKDWFTETNKIISARLKNLSWLLLRLHEQRGTYIPAWSVFNEVCSEIDPPITTAGMLPILQAPADDNNTITTVINRFCDITNKLSQKNTVLFLDQPLYSRCKELVWANQEKYANVVLMLGDLHILFNFLKVIGQHF